MQETGSMPVVHVQNPKLILKLFKDFFKNWQNWHQSCTTPNNCLKHITLFTYLTAFFSPLLIWRRNLRGVTGCWIILGGTVVTNFHKLGCFQFEVIILNLTSPHLPTDAFTILPFFFLAFQFIKISSVWGYDQRFPRGSQRAASTALPGSAVAVPTTE